MRWSRVQGVALPVGKASLPVLFAVALCGLTTAGVYGQAAPAPQDRANQPNSIPDQSGTQDPSAKGALPSEKAPENPPPHGGNSPFVDGKINVPDANPNAQDVPAKFSKQNAELDKIPTMGRGPQLTDKDKALIWANVKTGTRSMDGILGPATELPNNVEMVEWPKTVLDQVPSLAGTKYVALTDRLLIVWPDNWILVSELMK